MSLEKRISVAAIELYDTGHVGIKIRKQIFDVATNREERSEPHRTLIDVDTSAAAQMAFVNRHLMEMGYPPVADEDIAKIEAFRAVVNRPSADFKGAIDDVTKNALADNATLAVQLSDLTAELAKQSADYAVLREEVTRLQQAADDE